MTLNERIGEVLSVLNHLERKRHDQLGYTHKPNEWHAVERSKYIALDCGGSGAFLVDRSTGELYNIQGYGRPDQNKKRKADIGNIGTVNPEVLWTKRYNYLR